MAHLQTSSACGFNLHLTRRAALGGMGAALTLAAMPRAKAAVSFPQRLVIVNMLGGVDGLSIVVPYGDSALAGLRASLLPPPVGTKGGMYDLGGFFGLTPYMPNFYSMFAAGQALAVQAVAPIYATRSHFLGQNILQYGDTTPDGSGWINRLVGLLSTQPGGVQAGMVMGLQTPTIAQGGSQFSGWSPGGFTPAQNTLAALIETLGAPDPLIGSAIQAGFQDHTSFQAWQAGQSNTGLSPFNLSMRDAGLFLAAAGGPAVAVIETASLDTHNNQVARLGSALADIDQGLAALAKAAGSSWANTVVMTLTEFGRTAYVNGSAGSDHGSGFCVLLAGGAVQGGKVLGTWPGLSSSALENGRDLQGTTDIRAIAMGVLQDHMQLSPSALATVFPGASSVSPMTGLVH